jgi:YVTN family beta-propeller protein
MRSVATLAAMRGPIALLLAGAMPGCAPPVASQTPTPASAPGQGFGYELGVTSESGDKITWIRPGADTLVLGREVPIGIMPADIDGPHNITMSPDGRSYYVSIAHGAPYGTLWRMDAATDTVIGRAQLEYYPTTISLTPDGELAFVANSDFFGDRPRVNPVSIVHTPTMQKIADIPACDMPHGVRVNHAGSRVIVTCMHSDELVEFDVSTFSIVRRATTGAGMPIAPAGAHAAHAPPPGTSVGAVCAPTYVSISPDDRTLYVACNTGNTLQVWDAVTLEKRGEVAVGKGAYNVEVSPDGRLVLVTNKKDKSVSLVDARSLKVLATMATTKGVVHGIAWSPDGTYAYISAESVGADPGSVDMVDISARAIVATYPVAAQPTGITLRRLH